jgi:hypothetical protein
LPLVALGDLHPRPQPIGELEKLAGTNEQSAEHCLAVAAALTVPRSAAEIDGLEIGSIRVEQQEAKGQINNSSICDR